MGDPKLDTGASAERRGMSAFENRRPSASVAMPNPRRPTLLHHRCHFQGVQPVPVCGYRACRTTHLYCANLTTLLKGWLIMSTGVYCTSE